MVAPGGQFAVQVPANQEHPSQTLARTLAAETPFAAALAGPEGHSPPRPPGWYAEMLYRAGFVEQHVRLQVYTHLLEGPEAVVEWMRGSMLTDYQRRLSPEQFAAFDHTYEERLLATLSDERPYLFTFRRLLLWGRAPDTGAER